MNDINNTYKENMIDFYTKGRYRDICDKEVIEFIVNFKCKNGANAIEHIEETFGNGYCYYFALMLKEAFQRGELKWHRNHSHIVWMDTNGTSYDIYGPFEYYNNDDELVSINVLGDMIKDFKHIPYTIYFSEDFEKEAYERDLSPLQFAQKIYMKIPKEEYDDTKTVKEQALKYWNERKGELELCLD